VHSLVGFGGGFIGPLVLGWTLDLTGGAMSSISWGLAFATVAAIGLFGPLALALVPPDGPGQTPQVAPKEIQKDEPRARG
jgi:MFS family permease